MDLLHPTLFSHFCPLRQRAKIFRNLVKDDKDRLGLSRNEFDPRAPAVYVTIRRGRLLEVSLSLASPCSLNVCIALMRFVHVSYTDTVGDGCVHVSACVVHDSLKKKV